MASPSSAAASSLNAAALSSPHFRFSCFFPDKSIFAASSFPSSLPFPRNRRLRSSAVCFSRRQKRGSSPSQPAKPPQRRNNKREISPEAHGSEEDELDEDAFESLFKQLEEDLKNDDPSIDDIEDDISEEDLARLEQELAEALGDGELQISISDAEATEHDDDAEADDDNEEHDEYDDDEDDDEDVDEDEDEDEDEDDIERPVELKRWQLRRLATALKNGRRKTSIKNLAAELCLERAVVLKLLRDPPPNLLMMSAMLPDEAPKSVVVPENRTVEVATARAVPEAREYNTPPKVKAPLHVMHQTWSSQKRLKKVQVQTLARVYRRTKRPTNAMISSIVHVTSLPRKRIIKWFEDKRAEDGVPDQRLPYERRVPDSVG